MLKLPFHHQEFRPPVLSSAQFAAIIGDGKVGTKSPEFCELLFFYAKRDECFQNSKSSILGKSHIICAIADIICMTMDLQF